MPTENETGQNKEILFGDIAVELQHMMEEDQAVRRDQRWVEAQKIDQRHAERLSQIITEIGWPNKAKVGEGAAHSAWLIVQHADDDPAWQAQCLKMMYEEPEQEVSLEDRAYLEDRVLVAQGKPQRYGTQFFIDDKGQYGPHEIDDFEHMEERRLKAGMDSFGEYKSAMMQAWLQKKLKLST